MDLDTANSIEVITVSTSSTPGSSGKKVVPLQIGYEKFPMIENVEMGKLRRPVRPIDRQRMRPWLMELLDLGNVFGLRWTNRHQGVFQISWRHASRLGWNLETDGDVFERWARHTGIYRDGDPPEPKRWKANFRCALHSLHDVVELTSAVERKGRNACRTYRFLHSNDQQSIYRKKAKSRKVKEQCDKTFEKQCVIEEQHVPLIDSASGEDCVSESESEWSPEDKVIVQELNLRSEIPEEEYGLHHDHDYSADPDKTQKTIVLRQGVGSIVLHKEILNAPDNDELDRNLLLSNLDKLASAAMSSACMDEASTSPSKEDKTVVKMKHQVLQLSESNLKNLLRNKIENTSLMTRKRKALANEESKMSTSGVKKISKSKISAPLTSCPQTVSTSPPPPSPVALHRSCSPKILCRRSKRNTKGADCGDAMVSEPTEPLMSSCLLLLEAATRLDNAEKNGITASQEKDSSFIHCTETNVIDTVDSSCEATITVDTQSSKEANLLISNSHFVMSNNSLKSSSVSINQDVLSTSSLTQLLRHDKKYAGSEAKGLFSGSNIHSINSSTQGGDELKKIKDAPKTKVQQTKPNYIAMPKDSASDSVHLGEIFNTSCPPEGSKQPVIIQSSLPTLKLAPLKSADSPAMSDSLERKVATSYVQPLIVDSKSQSALLQGNFYSLISSRCSTTPENSQVVITPVVSSALSKVTNISLPATQLLLDTSYTHQSLTQAEGARPAARKQALVMYDLTKDANKDLKVHVLPVQGGLSSNVLSHVVLAQPSLQSSTSTVSPRSALWQLSLASTSQAKTEGVHQQYQTMSSVSQVQLVSADSTDNTSVQTVYLPGGVNLIDSEQNLLLNTVEESNARIEIHTNLDTLDSLSSFTVKSEIVEIDYSLNENETNSPIKSPPEDSQQKLCSKNRMRPLSELCKRYLSQLFSTLDNQSSESDDGDSVTDHAHSACASHSQTTCDVSNKHHSSSDFSETDRL